MVKKKKYQEACLAHQVSFTLLRGTVYRLLGSEAECFFYVVSIRCCFGSEVRKVLIYSVVISYAFTRLSFECNFVKTKV